jgi:hypothetical protein
MKKVAAAFAVLVAVGVALVAFNRGVTVVVINVGVQPLSVVVVHVTGESYPLGDIQAGETRSVRVSPTGESHVEIEHSKGRLIVDTYFESGYRGKIAIEVTESEIKRVQHDVQVGVI